MHRPVSARPLRPQPSTPMSSPKLAMTLTLALALASPLAAAQAGATADLGLTRPFAIAAQPWARR